MAWKVKNLDNYLDLSKANILNESGTVSDFEARGQGQVEAIIGYSSDLGGASNPLGNTANNLFYQGSKNSIKTIKFAKYLFYGIGQGTDYGNHLNESYYLSESRAFNRNVSSYESKNPSAGQLVTLSNSYDKKDDRNGLIIGGSSAPYNWSDFLYCKYYGRIPNNYMVTLRRYPTPMLDNLSIPRSVRESDLHELEGAAKPVAQAVTWFGGETGNTLNDIISFSTGMNWNIVDQEEILDQKGFDRGFGKSILGMIGNGALDLATGGNAASDTLQAIVGMVSAMSGKGEREITDADISYHLREKASTDNGPLSEWIFTSVDTIDKTYIRQRGLSFTESDIILKFHYELTSVGQVNTKAAFMDLFANLLSIGTNYGEFLRPDYRYDNEFPAVAFPGGEEGLISFYTSPATFLVNYMKNLGIDDTNGNYANYKETAGGDSTQTTDKETKSVNFLLDWTNSLKNISGDEALSAADRAGKALMSKNFLANVQLNQSFLTGAPVGEWHLVVGNPMNPIAMIGNLICDNLNIEFGEKLGPDDFPTEITATFNLKHGRSREKGEIESMFNRGKGRLYQSLLKVSSDSQSAEALGNINGTLNQNSEQEQTNIVSARPN